MDSAATPVNSVTFTPIGIVENEVNEPMPAPQISAVESCIVLLSDLAEGLVGLEPGHKVMVLFYFDRVTDCDLQQHPRGDKSRPKRGVFALRSPRRPNPIGVTVADVLSVNGNVVTVSGLDALNGTPVLDLKPA